ncbi:MAG: hypothetical protein NVV74_11935 [Magnetospirillum sp.]|nr:hypothetical protein [Magnetospirillum sp.]
MSRSRRHTPIIGITTADSEKQDKRRANRSWRAAIRRALREGEHEAAHSRHAFSDRWTMAKDGKNGIGGLARRLPALMRK